LDQEKGQDPAQELDLTGDQSSQPPEIDFTVIEPEPVRGPPPVRDTKKPSIHERREWVRGALASGLVVVFAALVLGAGVAVWTGMPAASVKDIMQVLLPPVVALTGTALGFYFGGERSSPPP